jgi:hypothetical protein
MVASVLVLEEGRPAPARKQVWQRRNSQYGNTGGEDPESGISACGAGGRAPVLLAWTAILEACRIGGRGEDVILPPRP